MSSPSRISSMQQLLEESGGGGGGGMASKPPPVEVVEIDSGSDDDDNVVITATKPPVQPTNLIPRVPSKPQSSAAGVPRGLECRSFWKAGGYSVGPSERAAPAHGQLEHARVHPKFLHSNATSHKWAFGAIAELLDNAVDEIQNGATYVKIDKVDIMKDTSPALLVQDDGGGMDPDGIRKCMSLGYSSKKSKTTIGQYGNGFKTSTMRLGADVIVFSRTSHASKATQSVGLLSYTFLQKTGQDDVIVPMVDFDISDNWIEPIIYSSQDDWSSNLKTILDWSPFESKDVLLQQFEDIGEHGTKVIIYNLWLNDEGIYELSFDDDDEDIRLRDEASQGGQVKLNKKAVELQSHISYRYRFSLRAYASILYLRKFKNFDILLRGKPVKQFDIANELKITQKLTYKPQVALIKEVIVEITIGFVKEAPNLAVRGFNVYHKNRLIRPFWKVTGEGIGAGSGIVGVLEANFIEPAHDKQDFERSSLYIRLEARLKQIYSEYWRSHRHLFGHQPPGFTMQKDKNAKAEKQLPGHGINEKLNLDGTKVSVPCDSLRHTRNMQFGNSSDVSTPIEQYTNEFLVGSHENTVSVEGGRTLSVEEIREANIGLFIKCEEQKKKETELKETVQELEKELEQAKRKCAQLAAHLETRKRQTLMKQQNVL